MHLTEKPNGTSTKPPRAISLLVFDNCTKFTYFGESDSSAVQKKAVSLIAPKGPF